MMLWALIAISVFGLGYCQEEPEARNIGEVQWGKFGTCKTEKDTRACRIRHMKSVPNSTEDVGS